MDKHERIFSLKEHFVILRRAASSLVFVRRERKRKLVNKQFKERIMLAVTEVNGCELCSFMHTKFSLSAGMDINEIRKILNGNLEDICDEELIAVLYGQHYADSKENPSTESVERLDEVYGVDKANMIKGFTHVITFTNSFGITMNLLKNRLLFRRDLRSNFINELLIVLSSMLVFPIMVLGNLFMNKESIRQELIKNP